MGIHEILNMTEISDKLSNTYHTYEHQIERIGHDVVMTGSGDGWTLHQWLSVAALVLTALLGIALYSLVCCMWKAINCTFKFAQCAFCGCCDLGINQCSVACMLCSVLKAALVGGWVVALVFFSAQLPICELGFLRSYQPEHAPDDNCKYAVKDDGYAAIDESVAIVAYLVGLIVSLLFSACGATCGREGADGSENDHHRHTLPPAVRGAARRGRRRITMMEDDDLYDL